MQRVWRALECKIETRADVRYHAGGSRYRIFVAIERSADVHFSCKEQEQDENKVVSRKMKSNCLIQHESCPFSASMEIRSSGKKGSRGERTYLTKRAWSREVEGPCHGVPTSSSN